jgi:hypothetical protein
MLISFFFKPHSRLEDYVPIILEHKGSASKSQKEMPTDL